MTINRRFELFFLEKKTKSVWIAILLLLLFFIFLQIGCERPTDANQKDDGIPPAVPTGVQIFYAADGEILVEWNANRENDLKGYNIFRKTNSTEYSFLAFTRNSYWFDDSLSYDEKYFYRISAIDIWNSESERSAEVSATPFNQFNPQKPKYITINARNWEGRISIFLSWEPNDESDISGYNIYRSLNPSFIADSTNFIGAANRIQFSDSNSIELHKTYHYKIRAKDKGGLLSDESGIVSDQVYKIAGQIFPLDDSLVNIFDYFLINALEIPANYRILVQTNEYYGEFWSKDFSTNTINDTLKVRFTPSFLYPYVYYYWRVITFSNNSSEPNSISPLYKFKVKP